MKTPPAGPKKFKALDEILEAEDKLYEDHWIEAWQTWVRIGVMTGADRDAWEQQIVTQREQKAMTNIRAGLVALVLVDEQGQRLATTAEQIAKLGKRSAKVLDFLFDVARRLNGFDESDIKALEKNSAPGLNDSPGTSSR